MTTSELEQTKEDLQLTQQFDDTANADFWHCMLVLCTHTSSDSQSVHDAVMDEIEKELTSKTSSELIQMKQDILTSIHQHSENLEYWSKLIDMLQLQIAKTCVAERLQQAHEQLKDKIDESQNGTDLGSTSIITAAATIPASIPLSENEEHFVDEIVLPSTMNSSLKKPHSCNRMITGFDWNKYNQTHYNTDNPPPKYIQGYKFTLYYPDLDKNKSPTYNLFKADMPEYSVIRFHAGPPYEDVAFRILNREWEKSQRRGFKCVFENGVLHLHFMYKKYRYKR